MTGKLINLKQIEQGSDLLKILIQYAATKVFTNIPKARFITDEVVTVINEEHKIFLNKQNIVQDIFHKFVVKYNGDIIPDNKFNINKETGELSFVDIDFTNENLSEPNVLAISYAYLDTEDEDIYYNVEEVIDLIKIALADTGLIEQKIQELQETINTEFANIKNKIIKDRIKFIGDIVINNAEDIETINLVLQEEISEEILNKLEKNKEYIVFTEDNKPIYSTDGTLLTYNINTQNLSGVPAKPIYNSDTLKEENVVYEKIVSNIENVKIFPIGTFTFDTLAEDYLLDNDEFAAASYQQAIDQLVHDLSKNDMLISAISDLINNKILTKILEIENTIIVLEKVTPIIEENQPIIFNTIHKNKEDTIVLLYINGVSYFSPDDFIYENLSDAEKGMKIKWKNSMSIDNTDVIQVQYTYIKKSDTEIVTMNKEKLSNLLLNKNTKVDIDNILTVYIPIEQAIISTELNTENNIYKIIITKNDKTDFISINLENSVVE